jgi:hypothetical protein
MKRVLSLILLLFILFSTIACSPKEQSTGTASESSKEGSKDTEGKGTEIPESKSTEDSQDEIPERYRLKKNIPADWNDPLPSSEYAFDSPLFATGGLLDDQQQPTRPPVDLPDLTDLFTIEELEAYFGMDVDVSRAGAEDAKKYVYYHMTKGSGLGGTFSFWAEDYGTSVAAGSMMQMVLTDPREIEGLGKRALLGKYALMILVTDTVVLSVSLELKPPEGGMLEAATDEELIAFARLVYERLMEKMK